MELQISVQRIEWSNTCFAERAMYEIQELAAAEAEDLLSADYDQVPPESRLFHDLQALAIAALGREPAQLGPIRPH